MVLRQQIRRLPYGLHIVIEPCGLLAPGGCIQVKEISVGRRTRIRIKTNRIRIPHPAMIAENQLLMVQVHGSGQPPVHIGHYLRIIRVPNIRGPRIQNHPDLPPIHGRSYGHSRQKPVVQILSAPCLVPSKVPPYVVRRIKFFRKGVITGAYLHRLNRFPRGKHLFTDRIQYSLYSVSDRIHMSPSLPVSQYTKSIKKVKSAKFIKSSKIHKKAEKPQKRFPHLVSIHSALIP